MSRLASCIIAFIALILCILVVVFGLTNLSELISSGTELKDTIFDIKSLRTGVITLCTVSIGLFTVFFELGSKDKYGHNIKQDNHFELTCLKKEVKSGSQPRKRALSGIALSVYPVSICFVLLSTLFYIFGDNCFAAYSTFILFCMSALLSCWYVLYILHVVYSRDWIVNKVENIFEDVEKESNDKIDIATKAMRILAVSDYPTSNDIIRIHQSTLFSKVDMFKGGSASPSSSLTDYYANLIVSYFLAAKEATESVDPNSIITAIFKNSKKKIDYSDNIGDYPSFLIPAVVAIKELNYIFRDGAGSPVGMDTLLLQHRHFERYKYKLIDRLNSEYGSKIVEYLSDNYIYLDKKASSKAVLPAEYTKVGELAARYFGNK